MAWNIVHTARVGDGTLIALEILRMRTNIAKPIVKSMALHTLVEMAGAAQFREYHDVVADVAKVEKHAIHVVMLENIAIHDAAAGENHGAVQVAKAGAAVSRRPRPDQRHLQTPPL